ncbi:MAG: hypothetical protein JNM56_17865 [Planctomycetia bacterium]|nr:hypothetical protein [Planctomycetia bacterium]
MSKAAAVSEPIAELQPGQYSDGHPLDDVHYLESKIILKPERFTSVKSFLEFGKLVAQVAKAADVDFEPCYRDGQKPQIREVVFFDTEDFKLYNNAFILRRRVLFEDGFAAGEPEVVFKFRHPELQAAATLDVRPQVPGEYRIKFKAEALPLRDRLGGVRMLYSHNVQFGLNQVLDVDGASLRQLSRLFPCLMQLSPSKKEHVDLVNQMIVEEVLVDLGKLDFGKGVTAKCNAALWRARGDHRPLVGEFAFQAKFERREEFHAKAQRRCEEFFLSLQQAAADWVSLGTTKTGVVYRLNGNAPQSHE